jgi:hypothetical protein
MNLNETGRIMKMLKAAYPNFDKSGNAKDIAALWAWRFKETEDFAAFNSPGNNRERLESGED